MVQCARPTLGQAPPLLALSTIVAPWLTVVLVLKVEWLWLLVVVEAVLVEAVPHVWYSRWWSSQPPAHAPVPCVSPARMMPLPLPSCSRFEPMPRPHTVSVKPVNAFR